MVGTTAHVCTEKALTGPVFENYVNIEMYSIKIEQTYPIKEADYESSQLFLKNFICFESKKNINC